MLKYTRTIREKTLSWPDNYYLETDAKKREAMLKDQLEIDDSEENQIRYQLFKKRYTISGKGITGADLFLRILLTMDTLKGKKKSFLGKRTFHKGVREIKDIYCLDLLKEKPQYASLWKNEFVNLWSLYLETCKEDKNYSGIALGLGHLSDDNLLSKIKNDIYEKTTILPEEMDLSKEMTLFRQAGWEAFQTYFPE